MKSLLTPGTLSLEYPVILIAIYVNMVVVGRRAALPFEAELNAPTGYYFLRFDGLYEEVSWEWLITSLCWAQWILARGLPNVEVISIDRLARFQEIWNLQNY